MRILITGANRGIGLELVRQTLARGDLVLAVSRNPGAAKELQALRETASDRLTLLTGDVSDEASVERVAAQVPAPLDVLINNAGVFHKQDELDTLKFDDALSVLSVNALGPLRMTRALLPQIRASATKKILHLTSGMGSISDNRSGGSYSYRMSKAALNMMSRSLAADLASEGIMSAVINPGWVATDMGGKGAPTAVEDSARGILARIDELDAKSSGEYLDYSGKKRRGW